MNDVPGFYLQRPLPDTVVGAIAQRGFAHVGGPVVSVRDLPEAGPGEIFDRWRLDEVGLAFRQEEIFLLTFPPDPLAEVRIADGGLYATGFLPGPTIVPVSILGRTRMTSDATVWRLRDGHAPEPVLRYQGAARGWRGASAYVPPTDLVGPRADISGSTVACDLAPDGTVVDLVVVADQAPAGFEPTRGKVSHRRVPVSAVDRVWAMTMRCTYSGVDARVLAVAGDSWCWKSRASTPRPPPVSARITPTSAFTS